MSSLQPYPLEFEPVLKRTIWGGRRLGEQLGKPIGSESDYAESWEVVDHGDDQSVVTDGALECWTLSQVIHQHRQWLVGDDVPSGSFPLLFKYLDCNRVLSVQVHPSDEYGLKMPKPDLGKTEAWYIVASDPESLVYAGLKVGVDQNALDAAMQTGQTDQLLHSFHPNPGDVVFIPAGTVHALGAGLLVAEIQQSSDTTFRLFDWNRVDAHGNSRPLHLKQALAVSDFESGPVSVIHSDASVAGWQTLVACDKFLLQIVEKGTVTLAGDGKFHIVTVPRGNATLTWDAGQCELSTGQTRLLPAAIGQCKIEVMDDSVVLSAQPPECTNR